MTDSKRVQDVNEVRLVGRLGQDPDIRTTRSGNLFATLNVATTRGIKDRNTGQWENVTKWTKVVVWNKVDAEYIRDTFRKGSRIEVFGELEDTEWQAQDGTTRYGTQVVIRPWAEDSVKVPAGDNGNTKPAQKKQPARKAAPSNDFDIGSDDVPF